MRVYTSSSLPTLAEGLASLLVDTMDAEPGRVIVVSPWVKDVALPVGRVGHFASLFGGHRDTVPVSEVLARLAVRHHVTVVTKPPHELVSGRDFSRLAAKLRTRRDVLAQEGRWDDDLWDDLVASLSHDVEDLARRVLVHSETVTVGLRLRAAGATLAYLPRLHAKLVWTPVGAVSGSANLTNGGLFANEELVLETTDAAAHDALAAAASDFAARAVPSSTYRFFGFPSEADRRELEEAEDAVPGMSDFVRSLDSVSG